MRLQKRWTKGVFAVGLALCVITVVVGVFAARMNPKGASRARSVSLDDPAILKTHYPVVEYRGKSQPFRIRIQRNMPDAWVPLHSISRVAQWAVIVSEDWAFYSHPGYDPNQIREVITKEIPEGRGIRGASTITQQLIKNVFLTSERSLLRKLNELALAVELDREVGKARILEVYLNIVEFGEGLFGIGPAARFYFNKSPADLSAREGAFLAMLLPSPKRYSQSFRQGELTAYARKTINAILRKMERAKVLTPEEREFSEQERLSFEKIESTPEVSETSEEEA